MSARDLLPDIRARLERAFGPRLAGVVLFGSEARDEAGPDSDIDLLVLLDGPVRYWADLRAGLDAVYALVLETGRPIHPKPVSRAVFEAGLFPLYRRAKLEGIVA